MNSFLEGFSYIFGGEECISHSSFCSKSSPDHSSMNKSHLHWWRSSSLIWSWSPFAAWRPGHHPTAEALRCYGTWAAHPFMDGCRPSDVWVDGDARTGAAAMLSPGEQGTRLDTHVICDAGVEIVGASTGGQRSAGCWRANQRSLVETERESFVAFAASA